MLIEGILALTSTLTWVCFKDKIRLRTIWLNTLSKCKVNEIRNIDGTSFLLNKLKTTNYGYLGYCNIPRGLNFKSLEDIKETLEDNLGCKIELEKLIDENCKVFIKVNFIYKIEDKLFNPIKLKPYELLIAYTHKGAVISNMEKYSHCLIGGGVGGGKSRLLMAILLNLINNGMVNLYLNQPIKSDLQLFKNIKCCKGYSNNFGDTLKQLEDIMEILRHRERIIDKYMSEGIFNISDYNKRFNNSLYYTYIVLEEMSIYSITPKDNKEIKEIKKKINAYIREILSIGRYVGIFVVGVIQKATSKSIDTDTRDLFNTRIMFKCVDSAMSVAVLGYANGKELKEPRECFILSDDLQQAKTYYVDFEIMKKHLNYG